tara:strand:- start:9 stop:824 length:816 start_codon:yes stop_codon:yes gene_type:complete
MKNIYTWSVELAQRNLTIADLKAAKGKKKFTQVRANTIDEAYAAEEAGIDMIISDSKNMNKVRKGSNKLFLTASLFWEEFVTKDEILKGAFKALENGADAVFTPRSTQIIEMLANEDIPVMGHLGLVPRKSSWFGGLRAVGKTTKEAHELFQKFKDLENAGAFAVEGEVIPENVMKEISNRTSMITISMGSGKKADVIYLFMEDICGETAKPPRHAKAYENLLKLKNEIEIKRIKALKAFKKDSISGKFPGKKQSINMDSQQFDNFLKLLD